MAPSFLALRAILAVALAALPIAACSRAPDDAPTPTPAQRGGDAVLAGDVRDAEGRPVSDARIIVVGATQGGSSDAEGRFEIADLPADTVRVRALRIGHGPVDTLLRLRSDRRTVWRAVLGPDPWRQQQQEAARALAERAAGGALDSVAAGHVTTDSSTAFTFERFGIELLRAAIASGTLDSNRVLSPLSAGQALTLAWRAARDSTALAIGQALHAGALDETAVAERNQRFNRSLGHRTDLTLRVANALWVDTSETLQPELEGWARELLDASVRTIPIQSPEAVPIVNAWADSTTNGRIPTVRRKPFGKDIRVVLANAVYLKGEWLEPFETKQTRERPFTTARGRRIQVPTMERTGGFAYRRGAGYQVVRLPYRAGLTAMYVVLPDTGVAIATVLDTLAATGWPVPDARSGRAAVHLRLPRLHVEQTTNLRPSLERLGLGIAFDSARADFNGLVVPRPDRPPPCPPLSSGIVADPCTRFRMDEATQSVYLDVDEKGTEAAAVTVLTFEVVVVTMPPPPIQFIVDRPFLLALRDERSGVLLFVGYVADPRG